MRALARDLGLGDIAELPAQPCLSSRVETGIAIDAGDLAFVEAAERRLAEAARKDATLRCRVTGRRRARARRRGRTRTIFAAIIAALCANAGRSFAGIRPYTPRLDVRPRRGQRQRRRDP